MNQQDEKVLEELGLSGIPDNEKKAVLAMIDQRLEKRFLANLLLSLDDDKRQTLEGKIGEIEEPKVEDVVRIALDIQPDAAKILAQSANEVMTELKAENNKTSDGSRQTSDVDSQPINDKQPTVDEREQGEDLPPVGGNATTTPDNNDQPSDTNNQPESGSQSHSENELPKTEPTPYNFDDTARQTGNATADYYKS